MNTNVATFKTNGKTYQIKRNRYLQAELEEIKANNDNALSAQEEKNYTILQDKYATLERLAVKVKELEDKYYETFDEEAGAIYKRAKAHYDEMFEETAQFEVEQNGIAQKMQKVAIDNAEKVVIVALQKDEKGNTIRSEQEATDIWCSYVDEVGQQSAIEWLIYFTNYLVGNDKVDDDPFVAQAKAKAEQRANMRKGLKMAK